MLHLLQEFTLSQILLFIIILAIAFKEVVDFIDWCKNKINNRDTNLASKSKEKMNAEERLQNLENLLNNEITPTLNNLNEKVGLLIDSDRDDIKAYITEKHHLLCYEKGWVDDYTLDCLERRYSHYVEEKGNSYIFQLMEEIRALPKTKGEE